MTSDSRSSARRSLSPAGLLAGFLAGAGLTHFAAPRFYDSIVPRALPGSARSWTYLSGVAELGIAVAVATPATRRLGAAAATGLFVAVYPANLQMTADSYRHGSRMEQIISTLRLPLQIPLVLWGLRVFRTQHGRGTA